MPIRRPIDGETRSLHWITPEALGITPEDRSREAEEFAEMLVLSYASEATSAATPARAAFASRAASSERLSYAAFRRLNTNDLDQVQLMRAWRQYKAGQPGNYVTTPPSATQCIARRLVRPVYDNRRWSTVRAERNAGLLTHKGRDQTWEHFFIKQETARRYPVLRGFSNSYANTFLRIPRRLNSKLGNNPRADVLFKLGVFSGAGASGTAGYFIGDAIDDELEGGSP